MSAAGQRPRIAFDCYRTPKAAFTPMLPYIAQAADGRHVWEPAQGDGRLVRWMDEHGIDARGTDITDPQSVDFLKTKAFPHKRAAVVVTNPPFRLGIQFCRKAFGFVDETFMLLRVNFLASGDRLEFWQEHPPTALFTLSSRPSFCAAVKCKKCKAKWAQELEAQRPRKHIQAAALNLCDVTTCDGELAYTTSDACEYAWFYWGKQKFKPFNWI